MSGIKRFFPVDKQRKSPVKKKKVEEFLLSSDDDMEVTDVKEVSPKEAQPASQQARKQTHQQARKPEAKPEVKRESMASHPTPQSTSRQQQRQDVGQDVGQDVKQDVKQTPQQPQQSQPRQSQQARKQETKSTVAAKTRSAAEILASIPSIELPSVEPGAKPNFRQIMERQSNSQSQGSDIDINAAPNCLTGLTFVVTGTLPTLGRDEIQSIIKRYGGSVTSSLSGKTSCLVLGEDAGPSKIQKAKSLKLKVLDEAGFLELLRLMPADGGSGKAAEQARAKREKEEEEIRRESKRLEREPQKSAAAGQANTSSGGGDMWTTKYAPHSMSDICGNNASVQKLSNWLRDWRSSRNGTSKGEGSMFRAAMLSGPPGIGKTTAAHLIGKLQGFDVVEYNASDTRSKSLLNQQVSQTLSNRSLGLSSGNSGNGSPESRKLMVIMDEVDGMSAGDRGGVGAMAALARTTNVPLVLICNERTLPKMRPFDRVVFDIQFRRPDESQVRRRLMSIAQAEGLKLDANAVGQLVAATRSDIRQMLNLLETFRTTEKSMSYDGSVKFSKTWNKELVLKPFDIAGRLLSSGAQSSMSTSERMELYFHDYDFAPLMIQENYLNTCTTLKNCADAASSISDGDLVDKRIHGPQQQWSLMPLHALLSCVKPAYSAAGQARGRYNFTSYLGNNSKGTKYRRLLAELRSHIRLKLATNAVDLRLELQPLLAFLLLSPLLKSGTDAIAEVIDFMDHYYITKEDWDVVMELGVGKPNTEDMAKKLTTQVKSAFTRKYNAMSHPLPYMKSVDTKTAAVAKQTPDLDGVVADDIEVDEDEPKGNEDDDLEKAMKGDKYIKAAKPKTKAAPKRATKPRAPRKKAT